MASVEKELLDEIELKTFTPKNEPPQNFDDIEPGEAPKALPVSTFSSLRSYFSNSVNITPKKFLEVFQNHEKDDSGEKFFDEGFLCGISTVLMYEPITVDSGHTFNKPSIVAFFKEGNHTCPNTRKPIRDPSVIDVNIMVKTQIEKAIQDFKAHCKDFAVDEERKPERLQKDRVQYPEEYENETDAQAMQYFTEKYTALSAFEFALNEKTIESIDAAYLENLARRIETIRRNEARELRDADRLLLCLPNFFRRYEENERCHAGPIESTAIVAPVLTGMGGLMAFEISKTTLSIPMLLKLCVLPSISAGCVALLVAVIAAETELQRRLAQPNEEPPIIINRGPIMPVMEEGDIEQEESDNGEDGDKLVDSSSGENLGPKSPSMDESSSENERSSFSMTRRIMGF